jgi:hypothetical protein
MNRSFSVALCLALAFVLGGCTHGIHSGTGGWPPASSTAPAAISSSDDVVKVITVPVTITRDSTDAIVTLSISSGYHINANPATFPYLIATKLSFNPQIDRNSDDPILGEITYPLAVHKKFAFADQPLAVYEGDVQIKLPLRLGGPTEGYGQIPKGHHLYPIFVKVQACDTEKCYAPDTLKTTIAVDVK